MSLLYTVALWVVVAAFVLAIIVGVFAWFTVLPVFGLLYIIGGI